MVWLNMFCVNPREPFVVRISTLSRPFPFIPVHSRSILVPFSAARAPAVYARRPFTHADADARRLIPAHPRARRPHGSPRPHPDPSHAPRSAPLALGSMRERGFLPGPSLPPSWAFPPVHSRSFPFYSRSFPFIPVLFSSIPVHSRSILVPFSAARAPAVYARRPFTHADADARRLIPAHPRARRPHGSPRPHPDPSHAPRSAPLALGSMRERGFLPGPSLPPPAAPPPARTPTASRTHAENGTRRTGDAPRIERE